MPPSSLRPECTAEAKALLATLARFDTCGGTEAGGITRLCASPADGQARDLFEDIARANGATIKTDSVGNQFAHFQLTTTAAAPTVMMGSHLDSQSRAGRYDGTLGVATALQVGAALMAQRQSGAPFTANFTAVNWTNEEGARFRPSLLGSGVYASTFSADYALTRQDDQGVLLGDALAQIGYLGVDTPPPPPACYLELHIEQGAVLEAAEAVIGIIGRNWGATKIDARFWGEQAHTGPTRMETRRDAMLAAAYAIADLREIAARWPDRVHTSVARLLVEPNSANVMPAHVTIAVEIRAADDTLLDLATKAGEAALLHAASRAHVRYEAVARSVRQVRSLPKAPAALVRQCAAAIGLRSLDMDTIAGHDAISLLGTCPIGLIFLPSIGGVTHNEAEATAEQDIIAGLALCTMAASALCHAGGAAEAALL